jgi:uncharacterized protein involved in response to NO
MTQPLAQIALHAAPTPRNGTFGLWALGFRPFYLLASLLAATSVLLWALQFSGWLARPYLAGSLWHAHEMVFGFALAVIVGFLLTAGRNWTGLPTTTPTTLKLLVALWIAARVLALTSLHVAAAVTSVAFPLAAAAALAVPFAKARNRRNYFFIGLLVLLALADVAVHLALFNVTQLPGTWGMQLALDILVVVMAVMAGRVIPMFTNNGVPGARAARNVWVERSALGSVIALLIADAAQLSASAIGGIAAIAAIAHAVRWTMWQPWKTLRAPLVWVLHAAYLWMPIHFALRAAAVQGLLIPSLATHALTVGVLGGLTIGMMTRTARGHTGRLLQADRFEMTAYAFVLMAAVARVVGPLAVPSAYMTCVLVSAAFWSLGFTIYLIRYWPILTRARVDGRPG